MKTRLLKRLRREAKKVYHVKYVKPYYRVVENSDSSTRMYYDGEDYVHNNYNSIQDAISLIIKLRRLWILNELIKFKVNKANKQLRKL